MNSKKRFKYVVKRYTVASGSTASTYTFDYKTELAYGHVESIGFCELNDGLSTGVHFYKIGLKQAQGENDIYDPLPKALLLFSGETLNSHLRFDERLIPMGMQMPAGGITYTVQIVTESTLDQDLKIEVIYKLVNYDVKF